MFQSNSVSQIWKLLIVLLLSFGLFTLSYGSVQARSTACTGPSCTGVVFYWDDAFRYASGWGMDAGTCFLQAYQKCQAATLIYIDQDRFLTQDHEKTTRTLTVDATTCKVSEVVQTQSNSATYTCDKMAGLRGSLRLVSCGIDGTFLLILDAAIQ